MSSQKAPSSRGRAPANILQIQGFTFQHKLPTHFKDSCNRNPKIDQRNQKNMVEIDSDSDEEVGVTYSEENNPNSPVETEMEDESDLSQMTKVQKVHKHKTQTPKQSHPPAYVKQPTMGELLSMARKFHASLISAGRTGLLAENVETQQFAELRKECGAVFSMLDERDEVSEVPNPTDLRTFLYHDTDNVSYLVQTLHAFPGVKKRAKTFGYVRYTNTDEVLMCKISGSSWTADPHPFLLDPKIWLPLLKGFAKQYDFAFPNSSYENHGKREPGDDYASHAEPQLMLWFASEMVRKKVGVERDPQARFGYFHQLKSQRPGIEADIVLSHSRGKVCHSCRTFRKLIQDVTGIKFHFCKMTNAAPLTPKRNAHQQNYFERYASEVEPDSDCNSEVDDDSSQALVVKSKRTRTALRSQKQQEQTAHRSSSLQIIIRTDSQQRLPQQSHQASDNDGNPFSAIALAAHASKGAKKSHKGNPPQDRPTTHHKAKSSKPATIKGHYVSPQVDEADIPVNRFAKKNVVRKLDFGKKNPTKNSSTRKRDLSDDEDFNPPAPKAAKRRHSYH